MNSTGKFGTNAVAAALRDPSRFRLLFEWPSDLEAELSKELFARRLRMPQYQSTCSERVPVGCAWRPQWLVPSFGILPFRQRPQLLHPSTPQMVKETREHSVPQLKLESNRQAANDVARRRETWDPTNLLTGQNQVSH